MAEWKVVEWSTGNQAFRLGSAIRQLENTGLGFSICQVDSAQYSKLSQFIELSDCPIVLDEESSFVCLGELYVNS